VVLFCIRFLNSPDSWIEVYVNGLVCFFKGPYLYYQLATFSIHVILKVHDLKKNLLNKVIAQGCVEIGNWRKCKIYL
jgi:hypothetical protein